MAKPYGITKLMKNKNYIVMQWTFGIQAILDTINQLSWHLITSFGIPWLQELPVDYTVVH